MRVRALQVVNVVALVATLLINMASVITADFGFIQLPLNGQTAATIVRERFDSLLLVPANQTFSVWSYIYTALIVWAVVQALPGQRDSKLNARIGWLFVLTCVFNTVWLFLFHYNQYVLSTVPMLLLLGTLITIYVRLRRDVGTVTLRDSILYRTPFSLYLSWITVATIANITFTLYELGWRQTDGIVPVLAAVTLVVGAGIAAFLIYTQRDWAYAAVFAWAYYGLYLKHADVPAVGYTALVLAVVGLVVLGVSLLPFNRTPRDGQRLAAA